MVLLFDEKGKNVFMKSRIISSVLVSMLIIGTVIVAPLLSSEASSTTSVTIVNNSNRQIVHLYLSPTTQEDWGPDQLNSSTISPGGTYNLNGVACSGSDIKVIAEDQDGCFLYQVVTCGEASTWTMTSSTARDCGN